MKKKTPVDPRVMKAARLMAQASIGIKGITMECQTDCYWIDSLECLLERLKKAVEKKK